MKKTLLTIATAALLTLAIPATVRANDDARFHQRWASLGVGTVAVLALDAAFDRLAANDPKQVRNGMTALFSMLIVVGVEAARQYQANENGVDMGNVAAGATGALIGASWAF